MSGPEAYSAALPGVSPLVTTPGDIYELVIRSRVAQENQVCINVFHLRAVTPGATANAIIQDFRTNMEAEYRNCYSSASVLERYLCFNLIPYQTDVAETFVTLNGTGGSGNLPTVCAAIVTWRTALIGRRYRGRTYFGIMPPGNVVSSKIAGAGSTSPYDTWANKMLGRWGATGSSSDIRMGVWSRLLGNQTPPHNPAGFTQITSKTVQPNVGSMGTRRVGRGT